MHDTTVIDAVTDERLGELYQRFVATVAEHGFHRTRVKNSLLTMFEELCSEYEGPGYAKNFIAKHPYRKELYWMEVFRLFAIVHQYRHGELALINSGIVGWIQHDALMDTY